MAKISGSTEEVMQVLANEVSRLASQTTAMRFAIQCMYVALKKSDAFVRSGVDDPVLFLARRTFGPSALHPNKEMLSILEEMFASDSAEIVPFTGNQ
jgi:hypothetical protein